MDGDQDEKQGPAVESPPHDYSDNDVMDDDHLGGDTDEVCKGVDDSVDLMEAVAAPVQPPVPGESGKSAEQEVVRQDYADTVDRSKGNQAEFDIHEGVSIMPDGGAAGNDHASNYSSRIDADKVECGSALPEARVLPRGVCVGDYVMDDGADATGLAGDALNVAAAHEGKQVLSDVVASESIEVGGV